MTVSDLYMFCEALDVTLTEKVTGYFTLDLRKLSLSLPNREQMSPFYFKFQFRNVEYSSGRNKTLLCFRVDTAGGSAEPLKGYMEDEHATAHAEEAFFQQVLNAHTQLFSLLNPTRDLISIHQQPSSCLFLI